MIPPSRLFSFLILCCSAPKLLSVLETCLDGAVWTNIAIQFLESYQHEYMPLVVAGICFDLAAAARLMYVLLLLSYG